MNDFGLVAANLAAVVMLLALVTIKVTHRLWHTPGDRSIFFIVLGVLGFAALGVAVRFGLPRTELWIDTATALYVAVAVASAYRCSVHLADAREARDAAPAPVHHHDDVDALVETAEDLQRLLARVGHYEPCANPECTLTRREMAVLSARLAENLRATARPSAS